MKSTLLTLACCVLALAGQQAPPKPGPEQELLKKFAGEWDATMHMMGQEFKATSSNKLALGGLWLLTSFKADLGGQSFEGMGTSGYDPAKKKYVSTWIDSMTTSLSVLEGNFDKDNRIYTETGDGVGFDGKPAKIKSTTEFKDANTMLFTMYQTTDGKETGLMKITYTRKK